MRMNKHPNGELMIQRRSGFEFRQSPSVQTDEHVPLVLKTQRVGRSLPTLKQELAHNTITDSSFK